MKRKRFTEEQIIAILKEHEADVRIPELVPEYSVSAQSNYRWKSKFAGMEASDAKKLRGLEDENRRLKKLDGNLSMNKQMQGDLLSKNW